MHLLSMVRVKVLIRYLLIMGIGPNNWIFRDLPNINWDGFLFDSFEHLNFFHRYLYCTYDNILCLHQFCYITSSASGRTTSPVILPTIIFVFLSTLSCKASSRALQLFKYLYSYSYLSRKVLSPSNISVLSVTLFWYSRAGYTLSIFFVYNALRGEKIICCHFRLLRHKDATKV